MLLGFVNVFDNPARQTFVMEMVGRDELPNAVGLNSVVMNSSRVVGPAIGGILIEVVGLAPCFFFNAASYVAVIVALSMMDATKLDARAASCRAPRASSARASATCGRNRMAAHAADHDGGDRHARVQLPGRHPADVDRRRSVSAPAGSARSPSVMGAGAILGGLAAASRRGVSYRRLLGLTFAMGISILAAAAAPTLAAEVVALFFMGLASFAFIATANTTLQLTSRPEMRGRVMALYAIAFLGSTPVGSPIVGAICAVWGPRAGFAIGGIAAIVAGAVATRSLVRRRETRVPSRRTGDGRVTG